MRTYSTALPLSFRGSWERLWGAASTIRNPQLRVVAQIAAFFAWMAVAAGVLAYYTMFGLVVWPWRALFGRGAKRERAAQRRHEQVMDRMKAGR